MGRQSITIRDVARETNVSQATVSRVLSGTSHTDAATKERILRVSKELGYIPNYSARMMASGKSKMIGLVVNTPSSPLYSEIIGFVENVISAAGYDLMLCGAYYDHAREERLINSLLTRRVDGLILATGRSSYSRETRALLKRVPTVLVGKTSSFDGHPLVTTDNFHGGMIGTRYLLELGHRNIVFIGKRSVSAAQKCRAEGFTQTCEQWGVEPRLINNPNQINSIRSGYELAYQCLTSENRPTACFAASDSTAIGTIQAADQLGIRIPEDLSVLGFDNTAYASIPRINLTTIDQPKQMIADQSVEILLKHINEPNNEAEQRRLIPTLVKRDTCGYYLA